MAREIWVKGLPKSKRRWCATDIEATNYKPDIKNPMWIDFKGATHLIEASAVTELIEALEWYAQHDEASESEWHKSGMWRRAKAALEKYRGGR